MPSTCRIAASITSIVAVVLLGTSAGARTSAEAAFMPVGDIADAPSGFVEMCDRDAALCRASLGRGGNSAGQGSMFPHVRSEPSGARSLMVSYSAVSSSLPLASPDAEPSLLSLSTAEELTFVKSVNTQVNRAIRPMADYAATGMSEMWSRPGRGNYLVGDCEDYAIEKRMRLIEAGFSPTKLFYSAAYIKGYGMHIVLVARLATGDMVLDNLSAHVIPWSKVRYNWLRVQSTRDPLEWHRLGNPKLAGKLAVAASANSPS